MPVFKSVDKNFFKTWSPDMAYVLGFFAADGYITVNRRGGQFWCIQITDEKLLKSIKNVIKAEHKISTRKGKGNHQNIYRIQIGSIEMCNDLRNLGYGERKTKNLAVPKVPESFFRHFVRGYFDGDGHIWSGFVHKERKTKTYVLQTVFTSCSKTFLITLKNRLKELLKIDGSLVVYDTFSRLQYSTSASLKIYDFMYNNLGTSKLFLGRKKEVFEKFIKMRL